MGARWGTIQREGKSISRLGHWPGRPAQIRGKLVRDPAADPPEDFRDDPTPADLRELGEPAETAFIPAWKNAA